MKAAIRISIGAFVYFFLFMSASFGLVFALSSGEIFRSFLYGSLGGFAFACFLSFYLFIGLILFKYRLLFYSNMEKELRLRSIQTTLYESVAGNTTLGRIKYGGLFLTHKAIMFIPHRFAISPSVIHLSLAEIKGVKVSSINLLKIFSGGIRKRLLIETKAGEKYEFSVWDVDTWIRQIQDTAAYR